MKLRPLWHIHRPVHVVQSDSGITWRCTPTQVERGDGEGGGGEGTYCRQCEHPSTYRGREGEWRVGGRREGGGRGREEGGRREVGGRGREEGGRRGGGEGEGRGGRGRERGRESRTYHIARNFQGSKISMVLQLLHTKFTSNYMKSFLRILFSCSAFH